jgi:hypothetical protein
VTATNTATATSTRTARPPTRDHTATPTPPALCSYDHDHWRDHPGDWPTDDLRIGGSEYSKDELLTILRTDPSGDPRIALAQQLIAAKLNAADGRAKPPADDVALGDKLLSDDGHKLPHPQGISDYRKGGASWYRGQGMLWVAATLFEDERSSDCGPESTPTATLPTAVNTVLGSTRLNLPNGLPSTGTRGPVGSNPEDWIITAMSIVSVSLLVALARRMFSNRESDG